MSRIPVFFLKVARESTIRFSTDQSPLGTLPVRCSRDLDCESFDPERSCRRTGQPHRVGIGHLQLQHSPPVDAEERFQTSTCSNRWRFFGIAMLWELVAMQANLGVMTTDDVRVVRDFAEQHALFIDAIVKPPRDSGDVPRFEAEIKTARDVGAQAARTTIIPGRRYERFQTLEEFRDFEQRGLQMLERAAPIVEKYQCPVRGRESQRSADRGANRVVQTSSTVSTSEHVSTQATASRCLMERTNRSRRWLRTPSRVHLKDQALRESQDGFLLGDIPLGQGSFDLKQMVEVIRNAKPNVRFALELITRDPLKVPCLTDQYFATMAIDASERSGKNDAICA